MDDSALTPEELAELLAFLKVHHKPLAAEIELMVENNVLDEVPSLFRTLYNDMKLFQAGEPTERVSFAAV